MNKTILFFLALFITISALQFTYFRQIIFEDNHLWVQRTQNLSKDLFKIPPHISLKDEEGEYRYGAHPGTSIILPATLLHKSGLTAPTSVNITIILLNSIHIAVISIICHKLRPRKLWWLAAATILALHPLYFYGTPTNIVIAPLMTLLFILTLAIFENRNNNNLLRPYLIAFGVFTGVGLATRLPVTIFMAAPLIAFIHAYTDSRKTVNIILLATLTGIILNPFMWLVPIEYITTIILRTATHMQYSPAPNITYSPFQFLYYMPLTIIGFTLIVSSLLIPSYKPPLPRLVLTVFMLITGTLFVVLAAAKYKTLRYLFPIAPLWDILLLLFLPHLSTYFDYSFLKSTKKRKKTLRYSEIIVITITTLSFLWLTYYNILIPGGQGAI